MVSMNRLSTQKRPASRVPGGGQLDQRDVPHDGRSQEHRTKLLVDMGTVCSSTWTAMRDLACELVQCDEIGRSSEAKRRTSRRQKRRDGVRRRVDVSRRSDTDTKLVPTFLVGGSGPRRTATCVHDRPREPTHNRIQLTTDGHSRTKAVARRVRRRVDYAQASQDSTGAIGQTSPNAATARRLHRHASPRVSGNPDPDHISHELRRAAEPHDADGDAPVHAADERLLQEGREPWPPRV